MKVATVLDNSEPVSIIRKHKGMISVDNKKLITSLSSTCNLLFLVILENMTLTKAPITPREVSLNDSKGLLFAAVFRNGYKNNGMCA